MNNKSGLLLLFVLMFSVLFLQNAAATVITATPNPYTLSNKTVDVGQVSIANTVLSNAAAGTTYYTGNWLWAAPSSSNIVAGNTLIQNLPATNNALMLTINALSYNSLLLNFNGIIYYANAVGTNTIYGIWTFNAFAGDNSLDTSPAPALTNTITIDQAPNVLALTPSNIVLDFGQSVTYNVILSGIGSAFTVNLVRGDGVLISSLSSQSAGTRTFATNIPVFGASGSFNVVATDFTPTTPFSFNSISNSITVRSTPNVLTLLPSNIVLDAGQSVVYNVILSGTGSAFTVNLIRGDAVLISSLTGQSAGTRTFVANIPVFGASGSFNVVATDTGTTTPFLFNSISNSITVRSTPTVLTLVPTNIVLDAGQSVVYNIILTGTGSAFTVNLIRGDGVLISSLSGQSSGTLPFAANIPVFGASGSFNVVATDTGTTTPFLFNSISNSITVRSTPNVLTLVPTNIVLDAGQSVVYNVILSGTGSAFTVNLIRGDGVLISSLSSQSAGTRTFVANIPVFGASGSFNVVATDTGTTTPFAFNSISNSITVYATPTMTLNSMASIGTVTNSIVYGNTVTVNALTASGSGSFAFAWTLNGVGAANTAIGTAGAFNVLTLPAAGNYQFNVVATDTKTTTPFVLPQATNTIVINQNASLSGVATFTRSGSATQTTSTTASYSAGFYDIAGISFNGLYSITNQTPWTVYLNSALVSTTNSLYSFGEQAQAGTYTFTFTNPGNNNYTSKTFTVTMSVSQQSTGGGGSGSGASYTTTVATTSTTAPTTTTTIMPVVHTVNGTANVSIKTGKPVEVNVTGTSASIAIFTTSIGSTAVHVTASNATYNSAPAPANFTKLSAINLTLSTTGNITVNATMPYPCSLPSDRIAPYIQKNGIWIAITPFTINTGACTETFTVPKDPIVGLLENNTPAATTTVLPTTAPTTTVAPTPYNVGSTYMIAAVVVIVIVAVVAYALLKGKNKGARSV